MSQGMLHIIVANPTDMIRERNKPVVLLPWSILFI
jgi:hypothetical protein